MALTKKAGSPYWYTRFSIDGVRIQESTMLKCKREALLYEEKRHREVRQELLLGIKPKHTWEEARLRWMKESKHKRSLIDDIYHFNWLAKHISNKYLNEITKDLIESLALKKEKSNIKAATVNRLLALIKAVLNKAYKQWEWINTVPYIRMRKEAAIRIRYLSQDEANLLLNELPTHLELMARFTLVTGLRQSNVSQLKWKDIDLPNRRLKIHSKDFKSGKDFGIPLNQSAINVLTDILNQHSMRQALPEYVFLYKNKPVIQVSTKAWYKALERAGIQDCKWHTLRHTFASWFIQAGGSLSVLQQLLGHQTIHMTLRYAHLAPDHLRKEIELIYL